VACRDSAHAQEAAAFIGPGVQPVTYQNLPALAERVIIAVPDAAITEVAAILAGAGMNSGIALHTCGALGPEALQPLAAKGVSCGTLHPLQTIATPGQGLTVLPGSAFAVAGDGWAREIVALLKGEALHIPAGKQPLYHAAAVMASNYAVALVDGAVTLMNEAGIERDQALRALAPLMRAAVENAFALGPEAALTGPIQRGDCTTVSAHLLSLEAAPDPVRNLYRAAGLQALEIVRRRLPAETIEKMEALLRRE
jgi:predicted short-subunit dehydrogenase-like oxidoreductase (DUF2520 family)